MKKEFETWALKYLNEVSKKLLLTDHYPITFELNSEMTALAQHGFNYPYKTIAISYSNTLLKQWKDKKFNEVKDCLVHEMCHSLTDPLYSKGWDRFVTKDELEAERERLTDHLANIIRINKII